MGNIILIPDRLVSPAQIEQEVLGSQVEIIVPCAKHAYEIDDEIWSNVNAILAWHELQYTNDLIAKLNQCKVIVRVGVGFDNVDICAAGKKGIIVCNVPDYATNDVADHAIGLLLTLSRGIHVFNEQVRDEKSWDWNSAGVLHRLTGKTLGIVGLGRIGTAMAIRGKALGLKIITYDPYIPHEQVTSLGVIHYEKLSDLLKKSDVISIHCPLTEETRGLAGSSFFNKIKKGAIFINTARGEIVKLNALTKALQSNHLRAAGMDVFPQEPPDPSHPLIQAWRNREPWISQRLIITPHAAFYNEESYEEMRRKAAEEVQRVLRGVPPINCVNSNFLSSK